ncbi:uncharacterized protein N7518_002394, partial [Penicillium psychrosexuale]|uniref:uncharacterized protein n=1 Tax=Penicillium psychrosexuale TaxID=1002107 RepID=UPI002544EAC6
LVWVRQAATNRNSQKSNFREKREEPLVSPFGMLEFGADSTGGNPERPDFTAIAGLRRVVNPEVELRKQGHDNRVFVMFRFFWFSFPCLWRFQSAAFPLL